MTEPARTFFEKVLRWEFENPGDEFTGWEPPDHHARYSDLPPIDKSWDEFMKWCCSEEVLNKLNVFGQGVLAELIGRAIINQQPPNSTLGQLMERLNRRIK